MRRGKIRAWACSLAFAAGLSALVPDVSAFAQNAPASDTIANDDWAQTFQQGSTLLQQGEVKGDIQLLSRAADIFRNKALPLAPKDSRSKQWGETQAKLGRALLCIGALTGNLEAYEQAAAALRAALDVMPRQDAHTSRADAQNNLGGALLGIGKLTRDAARFKEAEAAFRSALEIYTAEATPKQWADAHTNLGVTYFMLGDLTGDKSYFAAARAELTLARPMLAAVAANSVSTILKQIERRMGDS